MDAYRVDVYATDRTDMCIHNEYFEADTYTEADGRHRELMSRWQRGHMGILYREGVYVRTLFGARP